MRSVTAASPATRHWRVSASSTTTPSAMTMMAMGCGVGGGGGIVSRNNSMLMSGLPSSLPGASVSSGTNKMDFSRTGVFARRLMNPLMDMDAPNTAMLSGASSYPNSPPLKPTNVAPSLVGAKQEQDQRQLRQDEYEAAEALLFSMGRACPSNKDKNSEDSSKPTQEDEENSSTVSKTTKSPKKVPPKKKHRKTKLALPTKKNKIMKKIQETDESRDEDSGMPVKKE